MNFMLNFLVTTFILTATSSALVEASLNTVLPNGHFIPSNAYNYRPVRQSSTSANQINAPGNQKSNPELFQDVLNLQLESRNFPTNIDNTWNGYVSSAGNGDVTDEVQREDTGHAYEIVYEDEYKKPLEEQKSETALLVDSNAIEGESFGNASAHELELLDESNEEANTDHVPEKRSSRTERTTNVNIDKTNGAKIYRTLGEKGKNEPNNIYDVEEETPVDLFETADSEAQQYNQDFTFIIPEKMNYGGQDFVTNVASLIIPGQAQDGEKDQDGNDPAFSSDLLMRILPGKV